MPGDVKAVLELVLLDGTPYGRIEGKRKDIEWHRRVIRCPISYDPPRQPVANQKGIYICLDECNCKPKIYVGKSDTSIRSRLTPERLDGYSAVIMIARDTRRGLDREEVNYLESRLIRIAWNAKEAGSICLVNIARPVVDPEIDFALRARMESFLTDLRLILPFLGVDIWKEAPAPVPVSGIREPPEPPAPPDEQIFQLIRGELYNAAAVLKGRRLFIKMGSRAIGEWRESRDLIGKRKREEWMQQGILRRQGRHLVFKTDSPPCSFSTAAQVIVGGARNGQTAWIDPDTGRPIRDFL